MDVSPDHEGLTPQVALATVCNPEKERHVMSARLGLLSIVLAAAALAGCALIPGRDETPAAPVEKTVRVDSYVIGIKEQVQASAILTLRVPTSLGGPSRPPIELPSLGQYWRAASQISADGCGVQILRLQPRDDMRAEYICAGPATMFDVNEPGFLRLLDGAELEIARRRERDICTAQTVTRIGPRQIRVEARCTAQIGGAGGSFILENLTVSDEDGIR
jgi:hypothetical protein